MISFPTRFASQLFLYKSDRIRPKLSDTLAYLENCVLVLVYWNMVLLRTNTLDLEYQKIPLLIAQQ